MRYTLVIFDFDGTLADSADWFARELNLVAKRYRFRQATPEDLKAMRAEDSHAMLRRLGVARWKLPFIARSMRHRMTRDSAEISLFAGVANLLVALDEAGVSMAIVSSNAEVNVRRVLGDELAGRIDRFACGSSLFGKAAKIRPIIKRFGVPAIATLVVGDEIRDIDAAEETGAAAGAVTWGYADASTLEARRPAWVFHAPGDILVAATR